MLKIISYIFCIQTFPCPILLKFNYYISKNLCNFSKFSQLIYNYDARVNLDFRLRFYDNEFEVPPQKCLWCPELRDSYLSKNDRIPHKDQAQMILSSRFISYFCLSFNYTIGYEQFGIGNLDFNKH
jgi:hypothetical protein